MARWLIILVFIFQSIRVLASSGITYHGRLIKPDGTPETSSSVQFRLQIRTPGTEDCLMYEEIQTLDLSGTSGVFSLSLGDGSGVRQDANPWSLFDALSNRKSFSFSAANCVGINTYVPGAADNRKFRVSFNDGSGWESLPPQFINYIPLAIETYAVGGFPASSLLRVEDSGNLVNTSPLSNLQYTELLKLINGTSTTFEKSGELNGSALPAIGSGESVRWNGTSWESYSPLESGDETDPTVQAFAKTSLPTCNSGEVLKSDGSVLSCVTDTSGTLPDVGTAGTYTKVTTDAKGRVTSGTTLIESDLPNITTAGKVSGDAITSGEISGSTSIDTSGNVTTTGNITATGDGSTSGVIYGAALQTRRLHIYDDDTNFVTLKTPFNLSADYALTLPVDAGTSGQVLSTDGSGVLSWINAATGSVTSVTGTSPIAITGTASAPVVTLSDSGVGAATYGSATQVPVFEVDEKGLIQSVTNTTISGVSPVGSTLSTGKAWLGDASGDAQEAYINVSDLKKSDGTPQIPLTCSSSQTLTYSAVTDLFSCVNISISNTQISDLDDALDEKVAKSGDTMTGTLNLPSNGLTVGTNQLVVSGGKVGIGTATPSFLLDLKKDQNADTGAVLSNASTGTSAGTWFTAVNANGALNVGVSGSNRPTSGALLQNSGGVIAGAGLSALVLGTKGASMPIAFYTDDTFRMLVDGDGHVGIGTTTPTKELEVAGTVKATELCLGADCKSSWPSGGGGGTVTSVTGTSPIQVATGTSTPVISVDDASTSAKGVVQLAASTDTAAGLVVQADDTRLSDSRSPSGTAGGDLSGTYPNPTVSKINGKGVDFSTAPASGDFLKFDGTNFVPAALSSSDIPDLDAAKITSGTMATARLGSGTADSTTYLRGDGTWSTVSAGGLTNFIEAVSTSAPNTTIPVVSLTANNAATNVDVALSPKGEGALAAQTANGTATGGNKRGKYVVDWQMSRSSATQVASGYASVIGGGDHNTASGDRSTISGGSANRASASYSTVSGGSFNTASYGYSTVSGGDSNTASGDRSTISGGEHNTASGAHATVPGGISNVASGEVSLAANGWTTADAFAQSSFGRFNLPTGSESATSWVATDPLFVVGNGTSSSAKSNALMILKNGNVGIGVDAPAEKLEVNGKIKATELCIGTNCKSAWPSGGGSGTVTSVTSANSDIAITDTTSTPELTLNSGTGANQIVKLNASSELPAVSGTNLTDINAEKLQGNNVASGTPTDGLLTWNTSLSRWEAIEPASCSADETLVWSAVTDSWSCTSIAIAASQITSGVINTARLGSGTASSTTYLRGDGTWATPSGGSVDLSAVAQDIVPDSDSARNFGSSSKYWQNAYIRELAAGNVTAYLNVTGDRLQTMSPGSLTNVAISNQSDKNNGINFPASDVTSIVTDGAERFRVDALGNVGIGTTAPNSLLTVEGVTALKETTAPTSTASYGKIYVKSSDSKLYFMNDSGTETELGASGGGSGTPAGSDRQIQFNNSGAFGATDNLT